MYMQSSRRSFGRKEQNKGEKGGPTEEKKKAYLKWLSKRVVGDRLTYNRYKFQVKKKLRELKIKYGKKDVTK